MNEIADMENTYVRGLQDTASQLGVRLTGDENASTILDLIGGASAEQIAWERRNKGTGGNIIPDEDEDVKPTSPPSGANYTPYDPYEAAGLTIVPGVAFDTSGQRY